jgi:hypothetical protein
MLANNSIVKCSHCRAILPQEEFDNHECNLELKSCKRIDVIYFADDSYKDKKLMTGWGVDGILYTFEVVPRKAIPMVLPLNRRKVTDPRWKDETDGEVPEPRLTL